MKNSLKPVRSEDCAAANTQWLTPVEEEGQNEGGGHECRGQQI